MFEIKEIKAKSILVPSKLPGCDYVINCYTGCRFGCSYCYASFMGRFVDKKISDWGEYVYAKINAPELLREEISKLRNKGQGKTILLSSVTDPFQAVEVKYKLSERCLGILADYGFEGEVSILTKSPLVLNVLHILKKLKDVDVGFTVTTTDDEISRYFEKFAPPSSKRLEALKKLNKEGIKTYAFVGPLLPHFVSNKEELERLFSAISKSGTKRIFVEHINLSTYIKERMLMELKDTNKEFLEKFYSSQSKDYRDELNNIIMGLVKKYRFELLHPIIFHKEEKSKA